MGQHALNLDIDVAPLLQVENLVISVKFAQARSYARLNATELEMMNLTGDNNGMDMIMLPPTMRAQVPTSNSSSGEVMSAIPLPAATTLSRSCSRQRRQ
jgi:hypothetical protein